MNHFRTSTNAISLIELCKGKFGKYNLVTSSENNKDSYYQRDGVFDNIQEAYEKAGIELVEISAAELADLR